MKRSIPCAAYSFRSRGVQPTPPDSGPPMYTFHQRPPIASSIRFAVAAGGATSLSRPCSAAAISAERGGRLAVCGEEVEVGVDVIHLTELVERGPVEIE